MHNRISIVFSTKQINPDYIKQIKETCGVIEPDIIPIENNGLFSLSNAYNMGIEKAKYPIVVFIHDDIIFVTKNWARKILKHFKRNPEYGILGVAGTNNLVSGMWWEDQTAMHGVVNHTDNNKTWTSRFSEDQGNKVKEMVVLDGVLFALDKTKIKHQFDESFNGFHFYDLGLMFPNYLDGVKLGVFTDIRITHLSVGMVNETWKENKTQFEEKYKEHIPCKL